MRRAVATVVAVALAACGGGAGSDADAGEGALCGFDSDELLPYAAGHHWTFAVTDLVDARREAKHQELVLEGDELHQVTRKTRSTTRSLVRKRDGRVERLRQEKIDLAGTLVETSLYDPPQLRLDESPARIAEGAAWDEVYRRVLTDPGAGETAIDRVDHWEVLAPEEPCETPVGASVCLRVRRRRTAGGTADKVFTFARGIGKVREEGDSQLEELTDCWHE